MEAFRVYLTDLGKDLNGNIAEAAQAVIVGQKYSTSALDGRSQMQSIAKFEIVNSPNPARSLVDSEGQRYADYIGSR